MTEIWLNPHCSKCRTAAADLDAAGVSYTVRRYLDDPPTATEIVDVLDRLRLEPWDIARTADAKPLGVTLPAKEPARRNVWIVLLAEHPKLIQRPIITAADGTTVIGRDPGSVGRVIAAEGASEFPREIGKVATRELAANGITRYEQLAARSERELLAIHGVGPKAIGILRDELAARGLSFADEEAAAT